jgi:hypothetical protein
VGLFTRWGESTFCSTTEVTQPWKTAKVKA